MKNIPVAPHILLIFHLRIGHCSRHCAAAENYSFNMLVMMFSLVYVCVCLLTSQVWFILSSGHGLPLFSCKCVYSFDFMYHSKNPQM